jgi:thiol-disulfide isomerase/thioredoxin
MPDASRPAGLLRSIAHRLAGDSIELPDEGRLASFEGASGWLNTPPLTPDGLRGRVVLVDFWTYTCVNWLRTLPYVRAWAAKYADQGLTTVGVHTPEFDFEHDVENVRPRAKEFGVDFPIAIDNGYRVWQAFGNHFWPAIYLADAQGRIRYHHFGEGEYAMTEMAIQQLLVDAGATDVDRDLVLVEPHGLEVAADWTVVRSGETYLGHRQATGLATSGIRFDRPESYAAPGRLSLNHWAPSGTWNITDRAAVLVEAPGRIAIRFQARDVNLVMGPADRGAPVPFRVLLDGHPATDSYGTDAAADGTGSAAEQRTYQLIRQPAPIVERTFEIEFLEPGVEVFCFTFG